MLSRSHSRIGEATLRFIFLLIALGITFLSSQSGIANASQPTVPQPPRERILTMVVLGEEIGLREEQIRTRVQSVVEENLHAEIVSDEEAFVQVGSSFQKMLEDCRGAAPCYARLVGSVDARYLLVLSVRKVRDLFLFGSRLIDLDQQKVLGKAISRHSGQKVLANAIDSQLQKTVPESMWNPYGVIELSVQPNGSQIIVNDLLLGISPIPPMDNLLPGIYRVEARREGHKTASTTVAVNRGETASAAITLSPADGIWSKWWFWASVGLIVVSGTVAGIVSTSNSMPTFCSSPDPERCP